MWMLLRREYLLNARVLWLTYGLWSLFWFGYPVLRPSENKPSFDAWAAMVALACGFLPVMLLGREDKFRAGAQVCSLPVTRDAVVASRFVGGWMLALAGVGIAVIAMAGLGLAGLQPFTPATSNLPIAVITTSGLAIAVMLPFAIRFGVAGTISLLVGLQVLGMTALLASALFGIRGGLISTTVRAARQIHAWLDGALGPAGVALVIVLAIVALNAAAYRLAAWLYRRREY